MLLPLPAGPIFTAENWGKGARGGSAGLERTHTLEFCIPTVWAASILRLPPLQFHTDKETPGTDQPFREFFMFDRDVSRNYSSPYILTMRVSLS